MAQSRDKRNQRRKAQASSPTAGTGDDRRRTIRRVVLALMIVVGLAGILVATAPSDEPSGRAPVG